MKLEVDIIVYRRRVSPPIMTIEKMEINLGDNSGHTLVYFPDTPINFIKFKREPGRIIRELNRGAKNLRITSMNDFDSETWGYVHFIYWINSEDLMKVRMRKDIKNTVNAILERKLVYKQNPSRELSQMELRKRMYNGKCKRK